MNKEEKQFGLRSQTDYTLDGVDSRPIALTCCAFLLSIRQSPTAGSADAREAAKSRQLIDTEARSAVAVHTPRGAIELPAHNSRTAVVLFQF